MSIIKLNNIVYKYPNGDKGLNGINLSIPKGKKIALLGANGAGKTTLMMMLNGVFKPSQGEICYKDVPYKYNKKGLRNIREKVGVLFHNPDHQLFAPSVFEEISFGLCQISNDKVWIHKKVQACLQEFELEDIADKTPHQLSTGQKKRVSMASVLVMQPEVLVCDEPSASLDPYHSDLMFAEFDKLNKAGTSVIISTHDVDKAFDWADEVIIMHQGEILAMGNPNTILSDVQLLKKAKLKQPKILEIYQNLGIDYTKLDAFQSETIQHTLN